MSELNKESKLENLSMEELEELSGGSWKGTWNGFVCPRCGGANLVLRWDDNDGREKPLHFKCEDCNNFWDASWSDQLPKK